MQKQIVTLTINPALDKISGITQVVPNQKLRCEAPEYQAGGGGINVSRAIHRLGGESLALYPSGGFTGEIFKQKLESENVNYRPVPIEENIRENLTLFEGNTNQQFRFIMPGPVFSDLELENILDEIKNLNPVPEYLVASGSIPEGVPTDFYSRVVKICDDLGCKTIVDTSGQPLKMAAEAGVFLLKPNMRELANLAGSTIESEAHQIEAAQQIIEKGQAEIVIVSMGAGGALLVTEEITEQLRTPTVPIRSKLGAGDSMVAGVVLKLAQGESIRDATRYGIAAGAAAVMTHGTELCNKTDTDRLYQRLLDEDPPK
jgi:6-phosphofructokinase 2